MDKLKNKVNTLSERISKFIVNASKTGKEKRTEVFLKARLQLLHNYWEQFCEAYEQLCDKADEAVLKSDEFFISDKYSEVECVYVEAISWLQEQLSSFQLPRDELSEYESPLLQSTVKSSQPSQMLKLPKLQLPNFTGAYLEWPSFHDTYVALIHNNTSLSNVQKMHYLKSSITGEASKLLKHFSITSANYESAWSMLLSRYDNKRVLVNTNLHELITLPSMSSETSDELKRVLDRFNQSVRALENLSRPVKEWDDWLVYFLISKLDSRTRRDWETSLNSSKDIPAFTQLQAFLEARLQALSAICEVSPSVNALSDKRSRSHPRSNKSYAHTHHASSRPSCSCCQGNHFILFCPTFRGKSVDERIAFLEAKGMCSNCLKANHMAAACPSPKRCHQCNRLHHTMIHKSSAEPTQNSHTQQPFIASTSAPNGTNSHLSNNYFEHPSVLLSTAAVLLESPDGRVFRARALLDQGSESSFISEELVNILHLRKEKTTVSVSGIGQCAAGIAKAVVTHNIVSCYDSSARYAIQSLVLPKLTHFLPSRVIPRKDWPHIVGLPLADPEFDKPAGIDLILGVEVYTRILRSGIRHGPCGSPIAQNTTLGWILSGKVETSSCRSQSTFNLHVTASELNTLLTKFWETEEPPKSSPYTPEEAECEAIFTNTHYRNDQGRYAVKLPFRSNRPSLGNSRDAALSAFLRMEKKFIRNSTFFTAYSKFIAEYLSLNHMELVERETKDADHCYYLPHHAVFKPSSTTTKLRVVFNASQTSSTGVSLNDTLHIGPKLQTDVILILTRWRFYPYVYTADIEKMFRQILVDDSDLDFQRILWRNSPKDPIQCYRLRTVTYGTACAPYLACRVLHQLASDYEVQYPRASRILLANFYVDDALFGAFSPQEALGVRSELNNLLLQGGLRLRKWLSNSVHLLQGIAAEDCETISTEKFVSDYQIKTLGVVWSPLLDSFRFQLQLSSSSVPTKRSILSDISRIYDPCGWLSPVTVTAKIFLQTLWRVNLDWDSPLPSDLNDEWLMHKRELQQLGEVRIPRWIGTKCTAPTLELHGFCDASQLAYGAAVYLRVTSDVNNTVVHLLASKTRVSPLRTISLPRLELCGAVLLAELLPYLQDNLNLPQVPVHTWTDSTIVLAWLRAHPANWKVYVANRVSLIQEKLSRAVWHHVSSEDNPADCITRGIPASKLQQSELWWHGPHWLTLSPDNWPVGQEPVNREIEEEARQANCTMATATKEQSVPEDFLVSLLHKFSTLMRLFRVTGYCFRFYTNCKLEPTARFSGSLKNEEIEIASIFWIKRIQHWAFTTEIKLLSKDRKAILPPNSKLRKLNPILDENTLLRVGGRLKNAWLSDDEKYPLILPAENYLTHLIIAYSHSKTLHGGTQLTLHHIRSKYWIINGRNKVQQFIRRCVVCCRFRGASRTPLMGHLPRDRVRPSKPFLHTGVDFAGPFMVKLIRGRCRTKVKTYVACFVCLATRAVHLELVMDLTADAFIAAFRRFVSRRGRCARMYSDNGRTFIAADKQLTQHIRQLVSESTIPEITSKDGTEWHFIPPYSPHMGGLWEAGVKAMKHHLKRVVVSHTLSIEEMLTLLSQVEACLNSRPLQAISDDPFDINALTPGHFLVGESLLAIPEPSILDISLNRLSRWQMVQHMYQNIWNRWYKEYLHSLQLRYKWQHPSEPVRINDLVVIKDDNLPPQRWLLGRVVSLHPGSDGEIRVVTVRCKDGYFKRPVTKLCILPVQPLEDHH